MGSAVTKQLTFSVSVMAHESRSKYFDYLREHLGDVPFSIDTDADKLGTWENCKRAWALRDCKSDYHLVIQDDAVLPDGFLDLVSKFINKYPNHSYQLFNGKPRRSWTEWTLLEDKDHTIGQLLWGVAIMLRQDMVDEVLEWGDKNFNASFPDDTRIKKCLDAYNLKTYYPYPSLVDHRDNNTLVNNSGKIRRAYHYIDEKHIPKIIHQIWIGDSSKMPREWMSTWKNIDGWEYKLWTETEIDELMLKNRKQYDYYYNTQQYHGASDVARVEILEKYGGMYVDADTERKRAFEGDYLFSDLFAVNESDMRTGLGDRVANGIIGCQPNSPTIKEYVRRIGETDNLEPIWNTIGGTMFTQCIKDVDEPRVCIIESFWFLPISYTGKRHPRWREAIATHHWGTTKGIY